MIPDKGTSFLPFPFEPDENPSRLAVKGSSDHMIQQRVHILRCYWCSRGGAMTHQVLKLQASAVRVPLALRKRVDLVVFYHYAKLYFR